MRGRQPAPECLCDFAEPDGCHGGIDASSGTLRANRVSCVRSGRPNWMLRPSQRLIISLVAVLLLVLPFGNRIIQLYIDYLWFSTMGQSSVFLTTIGLRLATIAATSVLCFLLITPNLVIALLVARRTLRRFPARVIEIGGFGRGPFSSPSVFGGGLGMGTGADGPRPFADLASAIGGPDALRQGIERVPVGWVVTASTVASIVLGLGGGDAWELIARSWYASDFGVKDPLFGLDVSTYVFEIPVLRLGQSWLFFGLMIGTVAASCVYAVALFAVDPTFERVRFYLDTRARPMRTHLLAATAGLVALWGVSMWLGTYDVLTSRNDRMVGAFYSDIYARLPATQALALTLWLGSVLLIASIFRRNLSLLVPGAALFVAVLVLGRGFLPVLVQKLQVEPAEIAQEKPYIANNIAFTRRAYGLDGITEQLYPAEETIRPEDLRDAAQTMANIRLWDHRPLKDTYNQLQSIRPYYVFDDVDIDRYPIPARAASGNAEVDGRPVLRQVMLSARELAIDRLGAQAQTWVNQRLQYTHGYGVVVSPVNEVTPEGMPNFLVKDVPPNGGITIDRPEIYFGEQTPSYVVVNTKAEEFDYPRGDQNVFSTYTGTGGIRMASWWRRLALAWNLGDLNMLASSYLTSDSQLLMRRMVRDRVRRLAPFLKLDRDPYIVAAEGRLVWIIDAYTTSDRYPYAQRTVERGTDADPSTLRGGSASDTARTSGAGREAVAPTFTMPRIYNYIRNSVKVTVDAYDGTVTFYLVDTTDPIVLAYARMFPTLIRPISEMPAALRSHLRYPVDMFQVQSNVLNTYHVQDPQVFYNGEDVWTVAAEIVGDRRQPVQPYYVTMRIPGETREEFLLMLPFTPSNRDNMIAWLAARSDGAEYGKLVLFKFPKDRLVYGPAQIDARIDQDPAISSQLTLWNQQGSRVIRGHLLVIPIGASTLYVEPIYLQAETSKMPELKRVVVASGNRVIMEPTLEEGLTKLFVTDGSQVPPGGSVVSPSIMTGISGTTARTGVATPAARTTPAPTKTGAVTPVPTTLPSTSATGSAPVSRQTVRDARSAYDRALDALKAGDFSRFGTELRSLDERLRELERASGQ